MCIKTRDRAEQLLAEGNDPGLRSVYEEFLSHREKSDPMREATLKALQRAVWGTDSTFHVIKLSNAACGCA